MHTRVRNFVVLLAKINFCIERKPISFGEQIGDVVGAKTKRIQFTCSCLGIYYSNSKYLLEEGRIWHQGSKEGGGERKERYFCSA